MMQIINNITFTANPNIANLKQQMTAVIKETNQAAKLAEEIKPQSNPFLDRIYNFLGKFSQKILNSEKFNKTIKNLGKEGINSDLFQKIILFGNMGKEVIRCALNSVQSYNNQDMPYDKRVFLSFLHLGIGTVNISLGFILGLLIIKYQDKRLEKILCKLKLEESVHKATKNGLKFFLPVVLSTVIVKRIIAPAIATPTAGILKKKMMKNENEENKPKKAEMLKPENIVNNKDNIFVIYNNSIKNKFMTNK